MSLALDKPIADEVLFAVVELLSLNEPFWHGVKILVQGKEVRFEQAINVCEVLLPQLLPRAGFLFLAKALLLGQLSQHSLVCGFFLLLPLEAFSFMSRRSLLLPLEALLFARGRFGSLFLQTSSLHLSNTFLFFTDSCLLLALSLFSLIQLQLFPCQEDAGTPFFGTNSIKFCKQGEYSFNLQLV